MIRTPLRWMLGLLFGALLLSGCGVFGDEDAAASEPVPVDDVAADRTVRVVSNDRFFDISTAMVFDASGELLPDAMDTLTEHISRLSLTADRPTNAGVVFEDDQFVVDPEVPGSTPDIEGLAAALGDSSVTTLDLPFLPVPAEVDDDQAAEYAALLNGQLNDGIAVTLGGQRDTLSSSVLGKATTVAWADGEWVVSVDFDGISTELNAMFFDVGTDGGQATFTVEPGADGEPGTPVIVPGLPGTACCDEASLRRIIAALTNEADTAPLVLDTVDGPRGVAWAEDLGINELVGTFTTDYTAGQSRNINIERIAELAQGTIIEPGQTWSLNEEIGERTIEKGFVPAGTIINGHLTDSVGGGISQFATTIFNAAFFAGLEYDDYAAHSIYFSRYPYGREATISWPAPQLEIHNPTPYGILIWPTTTSNSVTVDLYSTKWVDAEQTGQFESPVQEACTRVTTERTRTFLDGTVDVDTVFAIYREEGIGCNGEPTDDPDAPPEPKEEEDGDEENEDGNGRNRPNRDRNNEDDETADGGDDADEENAGGRNPGRAERENDADEPENDGENADAADPEAPVDETEEDPGSAEDEQDAPADGEGAEDPDGADDPDEQTDAPADDAADPEAPAENEEAEQPAPEEESPPIEEIAAGAPDDAALGTGDSN